MSITVDIGGGQIVEFPDVETAQQFMASRQGQPSTAEDVGRGFMGGALRGAGAILDLPTMIGRLPMQLSDRFLGADMLAGQPAPTPFIEAVGQVAPSMQAAAEFEPQTVAGGFAQQAGEFLPGLITPGSLPARVGFGVLAPAIGSQTAGLVAEAAGAGETGQMLAELGGAIVSPVAAERALRGLISPMAGTAAPRVAAAETLRSAGVPVTAGQQTGSGLLRRLEDTAAPSEEQLEALTRAALRSIGSEGDRVTSDVLNAARNRIGGVFDDVTQNLIVDVQPFRVSQLQAAANTYRSLAPTGAQAPIIDDIVNAVANPNAQTSPRQLMTWRSRLSRLTTTPDAATREAASDALEAIDDIIADSLRNTGRDADVDALNQARRQWRDYLAIERAAGQAGETAAEGLLTPGALRGAVQSQGRGQFVRGQRGDLGDITRSAQAVLSSSPAVLPGGARVIEGAGRAAMAGLGGTIGGFPGAAAGFMAPEIARAGVMSGPMQAYLRNQLVGPAASRLTPAQRALIYGPGVGMPSVFNQGEQR